MPDDEYEWSDRRLDPFVRSTVLEIRGAFAARPTLSVDELGQFVDMLVSPKYYYLRIMR